MCFAFGKPLCYHKTMEFINVNPVEELTKAIGIVHGPEAEDRIRYMLGRMEEERKKALEAVPWTAERLQYLLDNEVRYKDWKFVVQERTVVPATALTSFIEQETDLRVRAEWMGMDMVTGKPETQQSRWWPLSVHMCKTEVIQTAFLCVLKAEEHEIRETFQYRGKAPFHTHIDVDTLAGVSDDVDVRTDPRPNAPANQRRE